MTDDYNPCKRAGCKFHVSTVGVYCSHRCVIIEDQTTTEQQRKYKVGDEVMHKPSGIIRSITKDRAYLIKKFSGDPNYKCVN